MSVRNFVTAIVVIPIAAILIVLALANRSPVVLSLDPFTPDASAYSVELPLFLVILLAIMVGIVIGGVADWLRQGRYRREARHSRSELRRIEREAEERRAALSSTLPTPYVGDGPR